MAYLPSISGTFTPTLVGNSTAGSTTYSVQDGRYIRIGNLVTIWVTLVGSAATGTGTAIFGAFPFTISNTGTYDPAGPIYAQNAAGWVWPAATTMITMIGQQGTTTGAVFACGTAAGHNPLQMANAAFNFQFTLSYTI